MLRVSLAHRFLATWLAPQLTLWSFRAVDHFQFAVGLGPRRGSGVRKILRLVVPMQLRDLAAGFLIRIGVAVILVQDEIRVRARPHLDPGNGLLLLRVRHRGSERQNRSGAQIQREGIDGGVRDDVLAAVVPLLPSVRKVVAQMDADAPLIQPILQREQFETIISQQIRFARLSEFFGPLAIILVATGLYGTLAYRVNRRTAEIGVRMAVGARRSQVVWMILRDSLALTVIGVVLGIPLAILVAHALASSLYGVQPLDPLS